MVSAVCYFKGSLILTTTQSRPTKQCSTTGWRLDVQVPIEEEPPQDVDTKDSQTSQIHE